MKIIILIIAFIVGLVLGALMMSLVAAQRTRELEKDVTHFKIAYETALKEMQQYQLAVTQQENVMYLNLKEKVVSTKYNPYNTEKE